jgi:hypothetical protein
MISGCHDSDACHCIGLLVLAVVGVPVMHVTCTTEPHPGHACAESVLLQFRNHNFVLIPIVGWQLRASS